MITITVRGTQISIPPISFARYTIKCSTVTDRFGSGLEKANFLRTRITIHSTRMYGRMRTKLVRLRTRTYGESAKTTDGAISSRWPVGSLSSAYRIKCILLTATSNGS